MAAAQFAQFHRGIGHDDVHQIDAAALPLRAGVGRAIGDAAHLFQNFVIEAAQEKRVGLRAQVAPALPRCVPRSAAHRSRYSGISRAIRWPC